MSAAGLDGMMFEAQAKVRRASPWLKIATLSSVCLVLGVLLAVQIRTQITVRGTSAPAGEPPMAVIGTLIEANARLRQERTALTLQIADYERTSGQERLTVLVGELNRLRIVNGLIEVTGPGVEVQIGGPVSALEMQDMVNELRNVGAEAIALNGERLVALSVIAASDDSLVVNGRPLTPPYLFQVIGNPQGMEAGLLRQGGLLMLLARAHQGQGTYSARQSAQMTLPIYTQPLQFRYARPVN